MPILILVLLLVKLSQILSSFLLLLLSSTIIPFNTSFIAINTPPPSPFLSFLYIVYPSITTLSFPSNMVSTNPITSGFSSIIISFSDSTFDFKPLMFK